MSPQTLQFIVRLLIFAMVFVGVTCLWSAVVLLWLMRANARLRQLQTRLGLAVAQPQDQRVLRLWHDGREATTQVPGMVVDRSFAQRLRRLHRDAGFEASLGFVLVALGAVCGLVGIVGFAVFGNLIVSAVSVIALVLLFWTYVQRRVVKQRAIFDRQFIDGLDLAARSLRAGHPLAGAFQLIAEEIAAPVGPVFANIVKQQAIGATLETALVMAANDINLPDFRFFAVSVTLQARTGGNLADMMDRIAAVVRDHLRLNRRAQVLTAQTQMSKWVLIFIPLFLFVLLNVLSPRYMTVLYDTFPGRIVLIVASIMLLVGVVVMNRLAILKY